MARNSNIRDSGKGKSTINSAQKKTENPHENLKKANFDRAKMLSDFAGMIIRLGFILAVTAYLVVQMQVIPWFYGMVLTVTGALFAILLWCLLRSVGLIVYYVLIEWLSNNPEKPSRFTWGIAWFFTILTLFGIAIIGVIIALNTPAFR